MRNIKFFFSFFLIIFIMVIFIGCVNQKEQPRYCDKIGEIIKYKIKKNINILDLRDINTIEWDSLIILLPYMTPQQIQKYVKTANADKLIFHNESYWMIVFKKGDNLKCYSYIDKIKIIEICYDNRKLLPCRIDRNNAIFKVRYDEKMKRKCIELNLNQISNNQGDMK